eukprot:m.58743 g.58743  ORF g.58743 m.58743 type:complete len:291 (-) comp11196_c0_seq1:123-995(-)
MAASPLFLIVLFCASRVTWSAQAKFPVGDEENTGNWTAYEPMWDEFTESSLNTTKWTTSVFWLGRQPGLFDPSNIVVEDGMLQMYAKHAQLNKSDEQKGFHNYTTAAMRSTVQTKYGYFEVKSKSGSGLVSSSWWFHFNNGTEWTEIDVFESTGAMAKAPFPHTFFSHIHIFYIHGMNSSDIAKKCNCTVHQQDNQSPCSTGQGYTLPFNMSDGFHVYGLLWNETHMIFSVDGKVAYSLEEHCFHQPIGMDFDRETMPGWFFPENPEPNMDMGSPFEVEYVRAWKAPYMI